MNFFTLTPWLMWLTIIRYGDNNGDAVILFYFQVLAVRGVGRRRRWWPTAHKVENSHQSCPKKTQKTSSLSSGMASWFSCSRTRRKNSGRRSLRKPMQNSTGLTNPSRLLTITTLTFWLSSLSELRVCTLYAKLHGSYESLEVGGWQYVVAQEAGSCASSLVDRLPSSISSWLDCWFHHDNHQTNLQNETGM